jgi:hypothetical protein
MRITAKHIDNGFFRLPDNAAAKCCVDGKLPRIGHEKRALAPETARFLIECRSYKLGWKEVERPFQRPVKGWIKRTRCSWHDGKPIARGWVWAFHVTEF